MHKRPYEMNVHDIVLEYSGDVFNRDRVSIVLLPNLLPHVAIILPIRKFRTPRARSLTAWFLYRGR